MSLGIDIVMLDNKIEAYFKKELDKLPILKAQLVDLELTLSNIEKSDANLTKESRTISRIRRSIENSRKTIQTIENREEYLLYCSKTADIIESYKKLLSMPKKISFFKPQKIETVGDVGKTILIKQYLNTIAYLIPKLNSTDSNDAASSIEEMTKLTFISEDVADDVCSECKGNNFEEIEKYRICKDCGSQEERAFCVSSYKDADRVSVSMKYQYDRKTHFRDCINQYQGKQNCHIDEKVYCDLEKEFSDHRLLCEGSGKSRFKKITKAHVGKFLRELHYTKHYENTILIHYNMTGIPPDDIRYLEDKLLSEFDMLVDAYDQTYGQTNTQRKNFISTHLILYKLLQKHSHPCKKEDFIMLKPSERKTIHVDILRDLFNQLGFEFVN